VAHLIEAKWHLGLHCPQGEFSPLELGHMDRRCPQTGGVTMLYDQDVRGRVFQQHTSASAAADAARLLLLSSGRSRVILPDTTTTLLHEMYSVHRSAPLKYTPSVQI